MGFGRGRHPALKTVASRTAVEIVLYTATKLHSDLSHIVRVMLCIKAVRPDVEKNVDADCALTRTLGFHVSCGT